MVRGGGRTESGEGRIGGTAGELVLPPILRGLGVSFFRSALQQGGCFGDRVIYKRELAKQVSLAKNLS